MSLWTVASLASAARIASAALRCWRIFCACSWSCQKSGCAVFTSNEAMVSRLRATSKIAPDELDSLLEFFLAAFQVFDDHEFSVVSGCPARRRTGRTPQQ